MSNKVISQAGERIEFLETRTKNLKLISKQYDEEENNDHVQKNP